MKSYNSTWRGDPCQKRRQIAALDLYTRVANHLTQGGEMNKINKTSARNRFEKNKAVIMVPCKFRPDSQFAVTIKKSHEHPHFDKIVNEFEYYNCVNSETGGHAAFYTTEE